ncbi:MAG TPA: SAM-dependent methyltransferase [Thermomicrobiales bacterium]|nr:SAM-dependent methyltransferase [Thermomicrobiales bacterium]
MADRIIASTSPEWRDAAREMLVESLPDARFQLIGEDLLAISAEGLSIADVARSVQEDRNPFIRHLFREVGYIDVPARQTVEETVDAVLDALDEMPVPLPPAASLQVWASGPINLAFRPDTLRRELDAALAEEGVRVGRAGMTQVISVCIAGNGILIGINGIASALSDWPGGRVRLSKPKGQISRSEFKLEELFRTTDLTPPRRGVALDLGASPGGWTRILRGYGLDVVAVDPADLDPRLRDNPHIRHVRTTAGRFLKETSERFDVIVNDMRMDPAMSTGLMIEAAGHLVPGGMMILTLKLSPHGAVRAVRSALARLDGAVDVKLARQLHHNRNEITVVGTLPRENS